MEDWKQISGYERYEISNLGRIRRGNKLLKAFKNKGYIQVGLTKDGKKKSYSVHRLVAQAFIPNVDNKPVVNHINGNKANNQVSNLEWATISENSIHFFRKLRTRTLVVFDEDTEEVVAEINLKGRNYKVLVSN